MKTIIDAVNELKGDLKNTKSMLGSGYDKLYYSISSNSLFKKDDYCTDYVNHSPKQWRLACTVSEFNEIVSELSHASWIKGASLAEYQAADKEVLKVESKTVEVDGMVYEIGALYIGYYNQMVRLDSVSNGDFIGVDASGNKYQSNWLIPVSASSAFPLAKLGTITPAPVKLVDGEVYQFDANCCTCYGRYNAGTFITGGRSHNYIAIMCSNITRLVPEVK